MLHKSYAREEKRKKKPSLFSVLTKFSKERVAVACVFDKCLNMARFETNRC